MQIEYLQDLLNYPNPPGNTTSYEVNRSIPETEITTLQDLYNNGEPFPKVLQELLYLAGDNCYLMDYGLNDSQQELQEFVQETMTLFGEGKQITRPFYAVDVYNSNDQFLFIYLDEGDDPFVHEGYYSDPESTWITKLKLSEFISHRVKRAQEGRNPF